MTIPYNASSHTQAKSIKEQLEIKSLEPGSKEVLYGNKNSKSEKTINSFDITTLINIIKKDIILHFSKINRLIQYLESIAGLCNKLNLPINWSLPSGLQIYQSYLSHKSISIKPFTYTKKKINLSVLTNDIDHDKQLRSLMPNLIHSLDATSMTQLYFLFNKKYKEDGQFYAVHDCFGTTMDKVDSLKRLLCLVYVELYSRDEYLYKFDENIIEYIKQNSNFEWEGRTIYLDNESIVLPKVDWVVKDGLKDAKPLKMSSEFIVI